MICSGCLGTELRRSRTRWYEYILRLISLRPFRCISCDQRTFRFASRKTYASATHQQDRLETRGHSKPAA
jgi:hypothetical protein